MDDEKQETRRVSKGQRMEVTDVLFREQIAADKAANEKKMQKLRELRLMQDAAHAPKADAPVERPKAKNPKRNPHWK